MAYMPLRTRYKGDYRIMETENTLRTLKDLRSTPLIDDYQTDWLLVESDLRREAINWIKALEKLDEKSYCEVCLNCMKVQNSDDNFECWKNNHYTIMSHWEESSDLE